MRGVGTVGAVGGEESLPGRLVAVAFFGQRLCIEVERAELLEARLRIEEDGPSATTKGTDLITLDFVSDLEESKCSLRSCKGHSKVMLRVSVGLTLSTAGAISPERRRVGERLMLKLRSMSRVEDAGEWGGSEHGRLREWALPLKRTV